LIDSLLFLQAAEPEYQPSLYVISSAYSQQIALKILPGILQFGSCAAPKAVTIAKTKCSKNEAAYISIFVR